MKIVHGLMALLMILTAIGMIIWSVFIMVQGSASDALIVFGAGLGIAYGSYFFAKEAGIER